MFAQQTMLPSSHFKANEITQAIEKMITLDLLSYSVVEGHKFQALQSSLEPRYRISSRMTFSRNGVPALYQKAKEHVSNQMKTKIKNIPAFSFTTDNWTSRAMDPFISFCLTYATDNFTLQTIGLENKPFAGSHTADSISDSLEKTIDDWELSRSVPIFSLRNNGSNMKAAMSRSQTFTDLNCFAHTLQLTIQDVVNEMDGVLTMLTKCKRIVTLSSQLCCNEAIV